jgi:hypothetical protein
VGTGRLEPLHFFETCLPSLKTAMRCREKISPGKYSPIGIVHGVWLPPNTEQGSRAKSVRILRTTPIQIGELRIEIAYGERQL